jgi:hypothetical protein
MQAVAHRTKACSSSLSKLADFRREFAAVLMSAPDQDGSGEFLSRLIAPVLYATSRSIARSKAMDEPIRGPGECGRDRTNRVAADRKPGSVVAAGTFSLGASTLCLPCSNGG